MMQPRHGPARVLQQLLLRLRLMLLLLLLPTLRCTLCAHNSGYLRRHCSRRTLQQQLLQVLPTLGCTLRSYSSGYPQRQCSRYTLQQRWRGQQASLSCQAQHLCCNTLLRLWQCQQQPLAGFFRLATCTVEGLPCLVCSGEAWHWVK